MGFFSTVFSSKLFFASLYIAGSIVIGIIFEVIVLRKLKKLAEASSWKFDDAIINSLKGMTVLWFLAGGVYGAELELGLPANYTGIINKILLVVVIFSITIVAARISVGLLAAYTSKIGSDFPSISIFNNIIYVLVIIMGVLVIIQSLGISIAPILTALGVGGLAAALALQDTLSNLFSGIHIIASRKVRPGDYVKLQSGEEGYVTDITWRNTSIRALPNNIIIVPNSKLSSTVITNYHQPISEMSVLVDVGVAYDSDLEKVEEVTKNVALEVMREVNGGVPSFDPFIRYHTFDDSSINFSVILRASEYVNQNVIKHEFVKRLHKRYKMEGIEIPFPIRTLYVHK
jgi:small-conductance mechanosensitive channel